MVSSVKRFQSTIRAFLPLFFHGLGLFRENQGLRLFIWNVGFFGFLMLLISGRYGRGARSRSFSIRVFFFGSQVANRHVGGYVHRPAIVVQNRVFHRRGKNGSNYRSSNGSGLLRVMNAWSFFVVLRYFNAMFRGQVTTRSAWYRTGKNRVFRLFPAKESNYLVMFNVNVTGTHPRVLYEDFNGSFHISGYIRNEPCGGIQFWRYTILIMRSKCQDAYYAIKNSNQRHGSQLVINSARAFCNI